MSFLASDPASSYSYDGRRFIFIRARPRLIARAVRQPFQLLSCLLPDTSTVLISSFRERTNDSNSNVYTGFLGPAHVNVSAMLRTYNCGTSLQPIVVVNCRQDGATFYAMMRIVNRTGRPVGQASWAMGKYNNRFQIISLSRFYDKMITVQRRSYKSAHAACRHK